ncbi:MAG: hypothetical protein A3F33_03875 [Candidatus Woykebacteria bacterium RIFCSPHIGHO2_12_FULL_43_10]|uniref:Uncharacterized protein n=2 Tax=Candidatus Woykeibacteriota TaxID=1817899 RepID=A0A1G1WXA2_9BACT|nr:MAG: hypothetical protein A2802_02425 [Candidatus Woykebacteria bacterium RIFCSPHIGHO2_01_FULL_43_29]OGY28446.1 MAG: hypothetical protein A3J50_01595 [Candidatus Woykebacteria bacterium RIFCSPHIGHO2_02_FULL_43_16b]OGY28585.1 MAG: hypothetical protein A3F33_03875 [Candidatus Woykebacteria bacterium RIFCSPHIGHO2_12_FULL_43_10]OGY32386.1 MAG: hypothetical protein A3A61_01355 [Candidatus Woykebacteria bacterium RIFCSPLOWO2_01_FULL_43_14]
MKKLLRLFFYNSSSFITVSYSIPSVSFSENLEVVFRASLMYAILSMFLRPLLNLLALPVNFLTFGLFGWIVNVVLLYVISRIEVGYRITSYEFPGIFYQGFVVPKVDLGTFWTAVLASLLISFLTSFLLWLAHD